MPDVFETSDAAGSAATSYALGVGQIAQGQLTVGSDTHDWYRVDLVAGQVYSFAMTGVGANNVVDPYLRLYSPNGAVLLAQNDDGLPGLNSIFTYTPAQSGTYFLDAGSYNNSGSGTYGVTVSLGTRPSFNIEMGAGVIDTDYSWSPPGSAATVTYGFRQSLAPYVVIGSNIATFSQVSAAEIAAIQAVLLFCADICNVTFSRVNPNGYTDNATILYANYRDSSDGSGAFAYYPGSTAATSPAGDVWLNTTSVSTMSLPFGSYSFEAILHETMHALGLSHPGSYNAAPGQVITYENSAQFAQDSHQYSAMSYFGETATGANFQGYPATPMLLDVYALQQIYGANTSTRTGDTVYGFGSNAGAVFDFAIGNPRGICIWDAGGVDTIDASGYGMAQLINLNAGMFSNLGGLIGNVSIALGAMIENAIGGSGDDILIGNSADNKLVGGLGSDKAVFTGHHGNYAYDYIVATSAFTVADQRLGFPDGSDALTGIETIEFSDGVFVPIAAGGLSFTATDVDDARPWTSIVSIFDGFGSLASETVENDNGTSQISLYDTKDAESWIWRTASRDAGGSVAVESGAGDDGGFWLTIYDLLGAHSFEAATVFFDPLWLILEVTGLFDNGDPVTTMNDIAAAYDIISWFPTPFDADWTSSPTDAVLIGGGNTDVLYGHAGNDTIDGAGGADVLAGGFGDDIFVFRPGEANGDLLLDFNAHEEADQLRFEGYGDGAVLIQTGPSHLLIEYDGGASHDVIALGQAMTVQPDGYLFV